MGDCINRAKLRGLIAEKGFNYASLARDCGATRDSISNLMRGVRLPSYRLMKGIAKSLEMTPEQAGQIFFATDLRDA